MKKMVDKSKVQLTKIRQRNDVASSGSNYVQPKTGDIKTLNEIKQNYFKIKDEVMEMSLMISSELKRNLSFDEQKMVSTKIVNQAFSQTLAQLKSFFEQNEVVFFKEITELTFMIGPSFSEKVSILQEDQIEEIKTSILKMSDYIKFKEGEIAKEQQQLLQVEE